MWVKIHSLFICLVSVKWNYQTLVNVVFVKSPCKIVKDALALSAGPQTKTFP